MKVWENYFEKKPKHKNMKIVSIVFEDDGPTFTNECLQLVNRRDKPIVVGEYVYHSSSLSKFEIKSIIKNLQEMDYTNLYKDTTKKCLFYPRVSINPPLPYKMPDKIAQHIGNDLFSKLRNYREWNGITNENKRYKNMNRKNTIRLTESELKKVITESVKSILKEGYEDPDFTNEFREIADALNQVRQGVIGKYLHKCKILPGGYFGMKEPLESISRLINQAISIAMSAHEQD